MKNKPGSPANAHPPELKNLKIDDDFDPEEDRNTEFLMEALEGETHPGEESCFHTPDLLVHINSEYDDDVITEVFKCRCGKKVEDVYTHSHTNLGEWAGVCKPLDL